MGIIGWINKDTHDVLFCEKLPPYCSDNDFLPIAFYDKDADNLRAENRRLRELFASAQKCAEEKTAMIAELHEQRDEIEHLRDLAIKLTTMCRAAAEEIAECWYCHFDEYGYGPVHLLPRLNGSLKPALFPEYKDEAVDAIDAARES